MKPAVTLATLSGLTALAIMHASLRQDLPPPAGSVDPKARTAAKPRIPILDLLNPETQLTTFQKYRIQTAPPYNVIQFAWGDPRSFLEWHSGLRVTRVGKPASPQGCIVSWYTELTSDGWAALEPREQKNRPSGVLMPHDHLEFQRFSEDGLLISKDDDFSIDGLIADLNGDGQPDLVEHHADIVTDLPLDETGNPLHTAPPKQQRDYIEVHPLGSDTAPVLRVLYNSHPVAEAVGNTWGFQAKGPDERGFYEIQLGPIRVREGVEPKVVFRWDEQAKSWIGPTPARDDHFLILGANEEADTAKLTYPLLPVEKWPADPFMEREYQSAKQPIDELSHPYRYRSLAALDQGNLFDFMARSRTESDFLKDRVTAATTAPEFWSLPPRESAWQLIHRNRPAGANEAFQIAFAAAEGTQPPVEGDLALWDPPSGCFAPPGDIVHHLHCSKEGSWVARIERIQYWFPISLTGGHEIHDFRRVEVSYSDARQLLQTIWWLSRARSRDLTGSASMNFMSGGSTSDGFAAVQFASSKESFAMNAPRSAGICERFCGTGTFSGDYNASAFINLVVQLFAREVPSRIGPRWEEQAIKTRWNRSQSAPDMHYTPQEIAHLRTMATSLLADFQKGHLAPIAAKPIVETLADMGWKDLRPQVERIASRLPTMLPHEKQLAEMDAELDRWRKKLGAEATSDLAHYERMGRREGTEKTAKAAEWKERFPGTLLPFPDSDHTPPKNPWTAAEEQKFGTFDTLLEQRGKVSRSAPVSDDFISRLRDATRATLQRLDCFDDVEGLYHLGVSDPEAEHFVTTRLLELDPHRAPDFLKFAQKRSSPRNPDFYEDALDQLANRYAPPLTAEHRAEFRSIVADKGGNHYKRERALQALTSSEEPDPELDKILLDLIATPPGIKYPNPSGMQALLARRIGGRAWDAIIQPSGESFPSFFPLTIIALREPEPYRARLQPLIENELNAPAWSINDALWSAWLLDLRDLKSKIERIATNSPEDAESGISSERKPPSTVRYHLARKIAALWNEEDPSTRTRLLIAFALSENANFATDDTALKVTTDRISTAFRSLSPTDQNKVRAFIHWSTKNAPSKLANALSGDLQTITNAIAAALPPE